METIAASKIAMHAATAYGYMFQGTAHLGVMSGIAKANLICLSSAVALLTYNSST
jgi:hypothetical protein